MLRLLKTGDVFLAENKEFNKTNLYMIVNIHNEYAVLCLSCGQIVGWYEKDRKTLTEHLTSFFNTIEIISSEEVLKMFSQKYKLKYPITSCYKNDDGIIPKSKDNDRYFNVMFDDDILKKGE